MPNSKWIISTTGERPTEEVAQELVKAGLMRARVVDGTIVGMADESVVARLLDVRGVSDVDIDLGEERGPLESEVT